MARIRSVHPGICSSEDMVDMPAEVERTYVRLWTHCDDDGRAKDNPLLIKAAIYPLHTGMTADLVDAHLDELHRRGHLVRYEVAGQRYLAVLSWAKWQKPQKKRPSDIPPPSGTATREVPEASRTDAVQVADGSAAVVGGGVGEGGEGEFWSSPFGCAATDLLAPTADHALREEATMVLAAFGDRYPLTDVGNAIEQLKSERRRFPYPSDLRVAMANLLGPPSVQAKPHALDDTAAAARRLEQEGNAYMEELKAVPVDPQAKERIAAIRAQTRRPA